MNLYKEKGLIMEESNSTDLDVLGLVMGKLEDNVRPLSMEECAQLVVKSIERIKRQLRYFDVFERLPEPVRAHRVDGYKIPHGDVYAAMLHDILIEASQTAEFGVPQRVVCFSRMELEVEREPVVLSFWLTQRGGFKVVIDASWRFASYDFGLLDAMRVVSVKGWEDLDGILRKYAGGFFGYGEESPELDYKFMCFNLVQQLARIVRTHEEKLQARLFPFTQSKDDLTAWVDLALNLQPEFRH